jgi:hypothetical protein
MTFTLRILLLLAFSFCLAAQTVTVNLNGTVSDDGLPTNTLTVSWSRLSGPGAVTFANPAAAVTTAAITVPGTYVLRLTSSDGLLSTSDDVTVTVVAPNKAPVVNAGPDISATMASNVNLNGTITDDGKPSGQLSAKWTQVSGPSGGTAVFSNPFSVLTSVRFDKQGSYTLRLSANDSQLTNSDDVLVAVKRK